MPQQPSPPPSPYGFITNPTPPPKRQLFGNGSRKSRILIVALGAGALIIVAILVTTIFSIIGSRGTEQLKLVHTEQQELIRIAEIGSKEGQGPDIRGYAATTMLSTLSSQQEVKGLLGLKGIKLGPTDNKSKSAEIERTLASAAANNRYDETVRELIDAQIASYNKALRSAQETNSGQKAQSVLASALATGSTLSGN